jgi:hypothetical protein
MFCDDCIPDCIGEVDKEAIVGVDDGRALVDAISGTEFEGEEMFDEDEEVRSWTGVLRGGKGVAGARAGVGGPEDDAGEEGCTTHILSVVSFPFPLCLRRKNTDAISLPLIWLLCGRGLRMG